MEEIVRQFALHLQHADEVAFQTDSLNSMIQQIHNWLKELERQVDERTAELREKNNELGREITERLQAEDKLRVVNRFMEIVLDSMHDSLCIIDVRDFRITAINRAFMNQFGLKPGEVLGRTCHEVTHNLPFPCSQTELVCPLLEAVKSGKFTVVEHVHYRGEGEKIYVEMSASPLRDEHGEITQVVHLCRDITARKLAEEERQRLEMQLRQSQKMEALGTLARGIAHDFNNFLTGIVGFAELARLNLPKDSPATSDLTEVLAQAGRAKDLINQILSFSRQEEGGLQPIKIHTVIQEALKLLRSSIPNSIEICRDVPEHKELVLADPTQIHQIVMNLGTNAYQAMRERGGLLEVCLAPVVLGPDDLLGKISLAPGAYLRLSVGDTGPGITPEIMERIFEPYFTTKPRDEGTGLGLAIVHSIVKNHHGAITVYSEPDQGTSFHVYLPLIKNRGAKGKTPADRRPAGGSERIMIIDDEKPIADLLQRVLGRLGYQAESYTSSLEAMAAFRQRPERVDLVIADLSMPKITGLDLAREFLEHRPELPVILCTGFSEQIVKEKAMALGVKKFVMKPLIMDELAGIIRKVLD